LAGSDAAYTVFANCIGTLQPSAPPSAGNSETTQPFSKGQSSQPFRPAQPSTPVINRGGFQNL